MAKQNYNETSARDMVTKTGGVFAGKKIQHEKAGIGVWGAIDYLIKVHKFVFVREIK